MAVEPEPVCLPQQYPLSRTPIEALRRTEPTEILACWQRTQNTLCDIRDHLQSQLRVPGIVTVAVSGSLGRMEQGDSSDVDLLVVTDESWNGRERQAVTEVWSALEPLRLTHPKSYGIYAHSATVDQLGGANDLGRIDEPRTIFGKRIQLLLDSQPVYQATRFDQLVASIVQRYASPWQTEWADGGIEHHAAAASRFAYLMHDLARYYRSLAIRAQWRRRTDPPTWRLDTIKFQHSRRLLYAGLLVSLIDASAAAERANDLAADTSLLDRFKLTPLERVACFATSHSADPAVLQGLVDCYEQFVRAMSQPKGGLRTRLAAQRSQSDSLTDHDIFLDLAANGQSFADRLTRLLLVVGNGQPHLLRGIIF